jgi:WD repeat-containing protein 35
MHNRCLLTIYNAIGIPLETKTIEFIPSAASMGRNYVFLSSSDYVLYWQFKTTTSSKLLALDCNKSNFSYSNKFTFH